MVEEGGDRTGVEACVDGVEDCSGHRNGEVELVNGGDVWGQNGDHMTKADA